MRDEARKQFKMIIGRTTQKRTGMGCKVIELNFQPDHVDLLVWAPPNAPVSKLIGAL